MRRAAWAKRLLKMGGKAEDVCKLTKTSFYWCKILERNYKKRI